MASLIYNGFTLEPSTGTGVQDLTITAGEYTGRLDRAVVYSVGGTGSYSDIEGSNHLVVTQKGEAFLIFQSGQDAATVLPEDTSTEVSGSGNITSLRINNVSGSVWDYLNTTEAAELTIGETTVTLTKQQLIDGFDLTASPYNDPGASEAYGIILNFENFPPAGTSDTTYTGTMIGPDGDVTVTVIHQGTDEGGGGGDEDTKIWFSNSESSPTPEGTISNITLTLDCDGNPVSGSNNVYINTDPAGTDWTVTVDNS